MKGGDSMGSMNREDMLEALKFACAFFNSRALMAAPGPGKDRLYSCEIACQNAIDLLSADGDPRVMTEHDMLGLERGDVVWIEDAVTKELQPEMVIEVSVEEEYPQPVCLYTMGLDGEGSEYRTRQCWWRCWNRRPSAEQREATAWQVQG